MGETNYWTRWNAQRLRRRRFLAGAGTAGLGAATLALVGCGDDDDDDDGGNGAPTGTATAAPTQATPVGTETPGASPTEQVEGQPQPGGVAVLNAAVDTIDSFDAHRSRFGPTHGIFAATLSRLLEYKDPDGEILDGDLAEGLPEMPDDTTLVFTLKPGIAWHDKPPVNGREFTVDDVSYFVERQKAGVDNAGDEDPTFYRRGPMSVIESVESPDERTVVFNLARPDATLLDVLAGPWNFLVAREAVESFSNEDWLRFDPATIIGTGPFVMDDFQLAERGAFSKFDGYYDQGQPYLDGMRYVNTFGDAATGEAAFRQKQVDYWEPPAKAITDGLIADEPDLVLQEYGFANPVLSTFATTEPPWNDPRILQALNRAFDRRQLIGQLHSGLGRPSANVAWVLTYWAIPQDELATLPGYLTNKEEDFAEARKLWEAAGGPDELTLTVPDLWAGLFTATAEVVPAQISQALGINVDSQVQTYAQVTQGLVDKSLSFWYGWGNPFDTPDPTATLYRVYHSQGSENQWGTNQPGGLQVPDLDNWLDAIQVTVDREERRDLVLDIQRRLIEYGGGGIMIFYNYINQRLNWPYIKGLRPSPVYFSQGVKNIWLDQQDPTYQGRPNPA